MVVTHAHDVAKLKLNKADNVARPKRVLMVDPEHFRVDYAINPYMTNAAGELNKIDLGLAKKQWATLKATYERLGFEVLVVTGDHKLPDMVFAANQSFPFLLFDKSGAPKKTVVLSRMRSEFRRPEVPYFKSFYKDLGYDVAELNAPSKDIYFEGNGDAIPHYPYNLVWGGYGERTSPEVYHELSERFGLNVAMLKLIDRNFYHLDTCFSILNENTVVIQKEAFDSDGLELIRAVFTNVIEAELEDNLNYFVCNCHSPDGRHVITHKGAQKFVETLKKHKFDVIEVDTGEYIKSGGSVFCMKMMVY